MTHAELGLVLLLGLVLGLMVLAAGCSSLKVEGECTYTREVRTQYQCDPGGKLEHDRLAPGSVPE